MNLTRVVRTRLRSEHPHPDRGSEIRAALASEGRKNYHDHVHRNWPISALLSAPAHIVIMFNLAFRAETCRRNLFLLQGLQRRSKLNRGTFSQ